jgi:hypothetical protein
MIAMVLGWAYFAKGDVNPEALGLGILIIIAGSIAGITIGLISYALTHRH